MYKCELGTDEMRSIYTGWISDQSKLKRISFSDGRSVELIVKDVITGMVGEWGAFHYMKHCGVVCEKPDCSVLKRDSSIWSKDLLALSPFRIITSSKEIVLVDTSITCKAQLLSMTNKIHEDLPSWTFQKETSNRHGDPMLNDPKCNKLLIALWINDRFEGSNVCCRYLKPLYDKGFRFRPKVFCFWWPQVWKYLKNPKNPNLIGKKKCLYLNDIKHLQVNVISID